jgi:hypothetical protein
MDGNSIFLIAVVKPYADLNISRSAAEGKTSGGA